jgi:hypothetical protein
VVVGAGHPSGGSLSEAFAADCVAIFVGCTATRPGPHVALSGLPIGKDSDCSQRMLRFLPGIRAIMGRSGVGRLSVCVPSMSPGARARDVALGRCPAADLEFGVDSDLPAIQADRRVPNPGDLDAHAG